MRDTAWLVALILLLLSIGALGWYWWTDCRKERSRLQAQIDTNAVSGMPPPGPIIDIDPKQSAGAAITVDSQLPECVAVTAGKLNKWWIGSIMKWEAVLATGQIVRLKKVVIPWKYNGTTKTLVIEEASSGFNYIYDGAVLLPEDYGSGSKRKLRQDFCQGEVDGRKYTFVYYHPQTHAEITLPDTDIAVKIRAYVAG